MEDIVLQEMEKDYRANEAYKTLRTNIEFSGEDNKVIVFTSCTPGEGKSTVSLSLAASLAETGKKVLFIDADLRKSVLAQRHKLAVKGLSHFLSGQADINGIIYKNQKTDLFVMFAGVIPPNPAELLGQSRFESLLNISRKLYDYVIVDTPPLGSVIDSAIIARRCDAAVLVIAANTISHKFAATVKGQLEKSDCPIIGVVLNKVDTKQNGYLKYYGQYYREFTSENDDIIEAAETKWNLPAAEEKAPHWDKEEMGQKTDLGLGKKNKKSKKETDTKTKKRKR